MERISIPQGNLEKMKEVLLYVLEEKGSINSFGETVLNKILYFIDFDYYEKFEEQLIGATYIKNKYGPTPIELKKVIDQMIDNKSLNEISSVVFHGKSQKKYQSLRSPDLSLLKANEIKLIDEVLAKHASKNATQISNYSHEDVPWVVAQEGQPLSYESVFYRTNAFSVRSYE